MGLFDKLFGGGKSSGGRNPQTGEPLVQKKQPFSLANPVVIRYQNFRGEQKEFTASAESIVRRKNHLSAQVAPKGVRISLARNRILNLAEVESKFKQQVEPGQAWPTARERQVLNYHKKYGTTSPLYEQIRARYPNW